MKIILSLVMIVLLVTLTACSIPENVATLQNLDEEATERIKKDTELKKQIDGIDLTVYETKVDAQATNEAQNARLTAIETKPEPNYQSQIDALKTDLQAAKAQNEALKAQLTVLDVTVKTHLAAPTTTPTPTPTGKLTADVIKSSDYVSNLEPDTVQSVDFAVKLVNSTGVDLTNIRLKCRIICNRDLELDDYPTMVDLYNNSLIYDVTSYDWSNEIEFSFTRSTGCSYVYLDKNQVFTINPVLKFIPTDEDSRRHTFSLTVEELTWEVK